MRRFWLEFLKRGLTVAAGGPVVLAIIYGILGSTGAVTTLSPKEVCIGILTVTLMAFIAAGITAIYLTDRLPLILAILTHGGVLYLDYLIMYLLNNWIQRSFTAIIVFSAIFISGFALVWVIIYFTTKAKTAKINQTMNKTE